MVNGLNRFGKVVSRRAGIIHLIELALEDGPVDTIVADKKENLMWREGFMPWVNLWGALRQKF
jgi:hypothetical protein